MTSNSSEKKFEEIGKLAIELGLDPFPVVYEVIKRSTMFNLCAYGLPARISHWSFGRSYDQFKAHGEMGLSKVYEIIINNDPSYAFLLDTNTEIQNILVAAHCNGHSHIFKHNFMFKSTRKNMVRHAAEHAERVGEYVAEYGFEKVEHIMDIGFSLTPHINWHKGLYRKPYNKKEVVCSKIERGEFDDIGNNTKSLVSKKTINNKLPPYPEKDLLWFFINYAPLEDWEKDILDIIREESFYFYPQRHTKIINEGFAVFWHAEIMSEYKGINPSQYLDFLADHEQIVNPGQRFYINPYYLGFKIFRDIEKRWDKEKVIEVASNENDVSFIRNYLTADLVDELKLFTYGYDKDYNRIPSPEKFIEIKERLRDEVVEALIKPIHSGTPKISIIEVGSEGKLVMKHDYTGQILDRKFANKTLEYVWDLWAAPIELYTKDSKGNNLLMCFDEAGFYERNPDDSLDFTEEEEEITEPRMLVIP